MGSRDRIIQLLAASTIVVCLVVSGSLATMLTSEAGRAQLTYADEATEGDPPEVAVGIAMGAFRGLFVNYLWIRAQTLKQEGKFFEAIQLSEAITRLQPRFPRVWAFHAWNMSYNISVATNTPQERWQWVMAGIDLLRSEAIPRNPNSVLLHKELAWIFVHKVQGFADDLNHYYKRELAKEWTIILGSPPRLDGETREDNMQTMANWLEPLVSTPDTLSGVIENELQFQRETGLGLNEDGEPESRVEELADRIRNDIGLPLGKEFLRFVQYRAASLDRWYLEESQQDLSLAFVNPEVDEILLDPRYADIPDGEGRVYAGPLQRLMFWIQRRILIDEKNMEPKRMQDLTLEHGPLDWRHPGAHAFYWARRGVDEALERDSTTKFDTLNTDRLAVHAVQEMFRFGEIQFDLITGDYFASNNFDWVDTYGDILEVVMTPERGDMAADVEQRSYTTYGAGYENFLRDVIRVAYNRGEYATARRIHERLRNWGGLNINDPDLARQLTLPLEQFVRLDLQERISTPHVAVEEAESALMDAYIGGLLNNKLDRFNQMIAHSQFIRREFLKIQDIQSVRDPEHQRMASYLEPTFAQFAAKVLIRVLRGTGNAEFRIGPTQAGYIYRQVPSALQRLVYDDLMNQIQQSMAEGGGQVSSRESLQSLFPEPPGMEAFREMRASVDQSEFQERVRQIEFSRQ